jgi:MazG family protein
LGDLLLEAVFFAQMAADERKFSISDSLDAINHKLVRRHPHVFGTGDAKTSEDVKKRWEEIKADEKKDRGETPQSILASVPRSLPALVEAFQISSKVAHIGFDWANTDQVLDKLHEELNELAEARQADSREELENEIGDILFALVNVARHLKVDPEQALRKSNAKFRRRFSHVEKNAQLPGATLEQMEALWQEAKAGEARGRE